MSLASRKLIQATAGATTVDTGDDDFANVVLLLDGDGTSGDANNTFTDSSTNGFTVTENGSVVQGSFSPYGDNWSNYFDGSDDAVYTASSTGLVFGTGDFTIECWAYRSADPNSYSRLFNFGHFNDSNSVGINFDDGDYPNKLTFFSNTLGGRLLVSTTSVASGEWYHIAVTRESGTFKLWLNGSLEDTDTTSGSVEGVSTQLVAIGSAYNRYVQEPFNGYISNARIVKGTAVYTSAFTPPTTPLTAISGTQLLLAGSNRFVDESSNNLSLTLNSTPKVTPFSPFKDDDARDITTDGGSAFFSASQTNNQLILADDDKFNPGSSDFTLEAWVHTVGVVGNDYQAIWSKWTAGGQEIFWALTPTYQLQMSLWFGGLYTVTTTKTMNANEWNHVAATRSGGTVTLWINGQSEGTLSVSGSVTNNSNSVYVGNYQISGFYEFNGYISDVRWVKGTALYTSAFTPPTSPLTAITNTETLLSFQDAGIYDRSGINNLDTVGDSQIDTAVKKYGTGSIEFDGTGDYLAVEPSEEIAMGTGDFTIEGWVNISGGTNTEEGVFHISNAHLPSNQHGPCLLRSNGQWYIYYGQGSSLTGSGTSTVNADQWYHFAYVRNSGTIKLYIDGTSVISVADTTNYTGQYLMIGGYYSTTYLLDGYIDDFRITKGIARYTANFTPPSAELPKF